MRGRPAQRGGAILLLLVLGGGAILSAPRFFSRLRAARDRRPGNAAATCRRYGRCSPPASAACTGVQPSSSTRRQISKRLLGQVRWLPWSTCGSCFFCERELYSQCETTRDTGILPRRASLLGRGKGASLFGYTKLYGHVPGGQAEYLRVPQAQFGPVKVPEGPPDHRYLFLSDVLPTAWQAVEYAGVAPGQTVAVLGLGPIGQMAARIALHKGAARVIGIDKVPERLAMAGRHGVEPLDFSDVKDVTDAMFEATDGALCHAVIDAVGMEASGSLMDSVLQATKVQPDKLAALHQALGCVRRGGTLSISGVYGGPFPKFPLGDLFDKQVTLRMGQANVRRWVDDILPLLTDADPLGVDDLVTHELPLDQAPYAYEIFQKKEDGCIKVILEP